MTKNSRFPRAELASAFQCATYLAAPGEFFDPEALHRGAEETIDAVLAEDPDHPLALSALALLKVRRNAWIEARALLDRARSAAPRYTEVVRAAAIFHRFTGEYERAEALLTDAAEWDPGDPGIHDDLAYLAVQSGDYEAAIAHGKLSFDYGGNVAVSAHYVPFLLARSGRGAEAQELGRAMFPGPGDHGGDWFGAELYARFLADFDEPAAKAVSSAHESGGAAGKAPAEKGCHRSSSLTDQRCAPPPRGFSGTAAMKPEEAM